METQVKLRFLLGHSNIDSEDIYATPSGVLFIWDTKIQNTGSTGPNNHGEYTSLYKTRPFS